LRAGPPKSKILEQRSYILAGFVLITGSALGQQQQVQMDEGVSGSSTSMKEPS